MTRNLTRSVHGQNSPMPQKRLVEPFLRGLYRDLYPISSPAPVRSCLPWIGRTAKHEKLSSQLRARLGGRRPFVMSTSVRLLPNGSVTMAQLPMAIGKRADTTRATGPHQLRESCSHIFDRIVHVDGRDVGVGVENGSGRWCREVEASHVPSRQRGTRPMTPAVEVKGGVDVLDSEHDELTAAGARPELKSFKRGRVAREPRFLSIRGMPVAAASPH